MYYGLFFQHPESERWELVSVHKTEAGALKQRDVWIDKDKYHGMKGSYMVKPYELLE